MPLNRRKFLEKAILLPAITFGSCSIFNSSGNLPENSGKFKRVRPGDVDWPSVEKWQQLNETLGGNLVKLNSPFDVCKATNSSAACDELFRSLKNPYAIGDNPALTQTSGWLDAWESKPSAYAVAVKNTNDIVAAVNFARTNNLRLIVKGGGHSYQGTSNSEDSLLVWTRAMNKITLHDDFVAHGCDAKQAPQPAVTIEAGAMWLQAYDAVTVKAGRYVQGGGCTTVGVAGLIQGGGFGSFSKKYGLAAAALLEAEIVMADGSVKFANACLNPDLFWALKGGGGGSFGIVTKLTLRTRELPEKFGAVFGRIKANDDEAFKKLIAQILILYRNHLFNPQWGEQISFHPDNAVEISMLFHGLNQQQAYTLWQEFESWVKENPKSYSFEMPLTIFDIPAQRLWDTAFLRQAVPQFIGVDDRPQAPAENIFWATNKGEAGQFLYAYHSAWMSLELLENDKQHLLTNAIFESSRHWSLSFHFNKGLAGAPEEEIVAARDTAMNPAVLNAFALVIIAGEGEPAFIGVPGHEPDIKDGRQRASDISKAMEEILKIVPDAGSYVSESNFFLKNWQNAFWGSNYKRLAEVKKKYDPDGLFFVHHGVGSEEWSDDGFTKIK